VFQQSVAEILSLFSLPCRCPRALAAEPLHRGQHPQPRKR
jgi:hypothetical protein